MDNPMSINYQTFDLWFLIWTYVSDPQPRHPLKLYLEIFTKLPLKTLFMVLEFELLHETWAKEHVSCLDLRICILNHILWFMNPNIILDHQYCLPNIEIYSSNSSDHCPKVLNSDRWFQILEFWISLALSDIQYQIQVYNPKFMSHSITLHHLILPTIMKCSI